MKKYLFLLFIVIFITGCSRTLGTYDTFAQCLTEKGVKMYGADTCPHCLNQKKTFKGSFDLITYIECRENPGVCQKADIKAYPTWEIDGKKYEGEMSLSALAEKSGCSLDEVDGQ